MGFRFANPLINYAKNSQDVQTHDFDGYAVTPADSTNLPNGRTRALFVTGAGNVNVTLPSGATAVLTSVPANTLIPIEVSQVFATSTTATGIFALY